MLRPASLQAGDHVFLFSPSGATDLSVVEKAESLLKSWQLTPVRSNHLSVEQRSGKNRREELLIDWQSALDGDEFRAIWCMGGDYGSLSLVDEADYSMFQGNPKWLIGMNDTTVFHSKMNTLGIETLYAFTPELHIVPEAASQLRNFLFGIISSYRVDPHPLNRTGYAESEVSGGRLNWVHSLQATSITSHLRGGILFIEDNGQDLHEIEKSILCLKYAGKLQHLEGLIAGHFNGRTPGFREEAYRIIRDCVEAYDFPLCFGFPCGDLPACFPLILGANIELIVTPDRGSIRFT